MTPIARNGYLLTLLLIFCGLAGFGQEPLTGIWLGKLTQANSHPDKYRFRLELKQEGTQVTGISHISFPDSVEIYARMTLSGEFSDGKLIFSEKTIERFHHFPKGSWCLKSGTLRMIQVGEFRRLQGTWSGWAGTTRCSPGEIALEKLNRQPKKPEPVVAKPAEPELGTLNGREITHQRDIDVHRRSFTVYVYDADKVDGDIVSLSFNGKWVLRNYPLKKEKEAIEIVLQEGEDNRLILYAENEGKLPPNTAAISFFDGKQQRHLNLKSDKKTCGALHFEFRE